MLRNSWVMELLAASQQGLSSLGLQVMVITCKWITVLMTHLYMFQACKLLAWLWERRWIAICCVNRKLLPYSCNKQVIKLDISLRHFNILLFGLRPSRWSILVGLYYQYVLLMHCNWETCVWEVHSLILSLGDYPNRFILDFLISFRHCLENVKARVKLSLCLIY